MLNIGPGQLVMIFVIALIVLGPDKLPQAMRTFGRVMHEMRRISSGFQNELRNALEEDETLEDRRRRVERETRPAVEDAAPASPGSNGSSDPAAADTSGPDTPGPAEAPSALGPVDDVGAAPDGGPKGETLPEKTE